MHGYDCDGTDFQEVIDERWNVLVNEAKCLPL